MSIDQRKKQYKELLNKALFLKNSMNEDLLVIKIEKELANIGSFGVEVRYTLNNTSIWSYSISGYSSRSSKNSNRLTALLKQLEYVSN